MSTTSDLMTTLALMTQATHEAGEVIMTHYRPGQTVSATAEVREKSHNNPLTKADLEADALLRQRLLASHPHCGWLSEETADNPDRLQHRWIWVVDPIDGTKEFIMGIPQFAISVALVAEGQPVAACIHNPASKETFTALAGGGAQFNGCAMHTSANQKLIGASCLASRSETQRGDWNGFKTEWQITTMGSIAYKLALVAAGRFDMTFTLTPKNEWDFCAGALLVQEAGGRITHKNGDPLQFNQANPSVRSVLATNGPLHSQLLVRLRDIPYAPDRH